MSVQREKKLNIRVSADVKAALVAASEERDLCINDVAVGILAERYGVRFHGTGRRSNGTHTPEGPMIFTVPAPLYWRIDSAAVGQSKRESRRVSKTEIVENDFREHFGLVAVGTAAA